VKFLSLMAADGDRRRRFQLEAEAASSVRLTHHNARVSYPTLLDPNTLLYIATAADSAEQTLYALDLPSRVARRITFGAEQYTSVSVGGAPDSRRLAVTVVNPTSEISTIPITGELVDATAGSRVPVSTANAHGPGLRMARFCTARHEAAPKVCGNPIRAARRNCGGRRKAG
jgi:hypothetical protein